MKALVIHEHGGVDKMRIESQFPDPVAGEGEVVLRVRACSLNYHDIFTRRGMPGITVPLPLVMGLDVAGEVAQVGPGVDGWKVGDRVVVDPYDQSSAMLVGETCNGGLAELCKVHARQLIRIPDSVKFEDAAALPVAFGTAYRMLHGAGKIAAGERILVLGASGGVGVACVLLSKLAGLDVVACAGSREKMDQLKALGADDCINYSEVDFQKEVVARYGRPQRFEYINGVNVVVNFTGGDTWAKSMRCLRRGGRVLTCGATAGFDVQMDLRYVWSFELQVMGSNCWTRGDIEALLGLVESGRLSVPIDHVYSLDEGVTAMNAIENRSVMGKVVVRP